MQHKDESEKDVIDCHKGMLRKDIYKYGYSNLSQLDETKRTVQTNIVVGCVFNG